MPNVGMHLTPEHPQVAGSIHSSTRACSPTQSHSLYHWVNGSDPASSYVRYDFDDRVSELAVLCNVPWFSIWYWGGILDKCWDNSVTSVCDLIITFVAFPRSCTQFFSAFFCQISHLLLLIFARLSREGRRAFLLRSSSFFCACSVLNW